MKIEELIERFKSDKKAVLIVAMGVLGMLLVLFSDSGDNKDSVGTKRKRLLTYIAKLSWRYRWKSL